MDDDLTIDAFDQLDRQIESAIGASLRARFNGQGDVQQTIREVNRLSQRRLDMQVRASRRAA